jgi:signal transduction histidine kinase
VGELLAAGWLFAVVPALVLARDRIAGRRRRRELNRSLHELRRPLQALALGGNMNGSAGFLDLALTALGDLDRAVNGSEHHEPRRTVISGRELVVAAVGRWRSRVQGLELHVYWDAGAAMLFAEPERIAQALDNLIANALRHGTPPLTLTASLVSGRVRITIADGGPLTADRAAPADPRHGHGLAVVSEIASAHGGRFALSRSRSGSVAALELPVAGPEALAAA